MRIYEAVPENLPAFHEFFRAHLLPVQLRHDARLAGRWETSDGRVMAIWEYDNQATYERIDAAVRLDPGTHRAQEIRGALPPLIRSQEEIFFMTSTADRPQVS